MRDEIEVLIPDDCICPICGHPIDSPCHVLGCRGQAMSLDQTNGMTLAKCIEICNDLQSEIATLREQLRIAETYKAKAEAFDLLCEYVDGSSDGIGLHAEYEDGSAGWESVMEDCEDTDPETGGMFIYEKLTVSGVMNAARKLKLIPAPEGK